ncbi:hypothetical protein [Thermovibrio sp.]
MSKSINQDIRAGGSTYHIQTEYYKSSGKIVTNIFKDGQSVKRFEKEVRAESEEEIDRKVEEFHSLIVSKLTGKAKKEKAKVKLQIPKGLFDEFLRELSPFFGIATAFILEEALRESNTYEELLSKIISDLEEDLKPVVRGRLLPLIEKIPKKEVSFSLSPTAEEEILKVLAEKFGIMANSILEEAVERCKEEGGGFERLVDILSSYGESPEEERELRERLNKIER